MGLAEKITQLGDGKTHLVMCRSENKDGSGAWVMVGANGAADGEMVARGILAIVDDIDLEFTTRCELIDNTESAITAWVKSSKNRRRALARYRGRS